MVGLTSRANDLAGSLAYGEQRRLEIARALGTNPGVILLDEPAAGTNPAEKRDLATLITKINAEDGVSVLLIEHDMKLVMMSHRAPAGRAQLRPEDRRGHTPNRSSGTRPSSRPYLGSSEEEAAEEMAHGDLPSEGPTLIDFDKDLEDPT